MATTTTVRLIIARIQLTIKNISVAQVHLKAFLLVLQSFCKHLKFDDRKDNNRTGTQGPAGPQGIPGVSGPPGPQGIQGIQGPSEITSLDSNNTYLITASDNATDGQIFFEIDCDPGDFVIDAGYDVRKIVPIDRFEVFQNIPFSDGDGYRVLVEVDPDDAAIIGDFRIHCFDNPPLRPQKSHSFFYIFIPLNRYLL